VETRINAVVIREMLVILKKPPETSKTYGAEKNWGKDFPGATIEGFCAIS
jgi:hypothetical protein